MGESLVQSADRSFWVCFGLVLWVFCVFVVWFDLAFLFSDVHVVVFGACAFCWTVNGVGCLFRIRNLII